MADIVNIGRNLRTITKSPTFQGITGLNMVTDDDTAISKGTDAGYVIDIESPWATDAQATWLLSKLNGIEYQPYEAEDVMLDPAAEIGDFSNLRGIFAGIYSEDINFRGYAANIGSPNGEDIDHEYPFKTDSDRRFTRKMKEIAAEFSIMAGEISAKVSKTSPQGQTSFGWSLTDSEWRVFNGTKDILRATSSGLEIEGKVTATSGVIGGATISNGVLTVANANISSLNGSKITDYSIGAKKYGQGSVSGGSGGAIGGGTISTHNTGSGINTSLGYADFANGVFNGWNTASTVQASSLVVQTHQYTPGTISFIDGNGNVRTFQTLLTSY